MSISAENVIAKRILEEAVTLFAHKGYGATSTREIVEAAGVTKPMLYYYFHSKEGLLTAALAHFAEQFQGQLESTLAATTEPYLQLVELVWCQLEFCQEHKPLARLYFALAFGPDDLRTLADLDRYTQPIADVMQQAIDGAAAARLIRAGSEQAFLMAARGLIHIWVMAALDKNVQLSRALAGQIVNDLLRGFHDPTANTAETARVKKSTRDS